MLFNLPKGFEFDPTYRYVGALPALAVNAYQTADARLGWHFAKKFDLSVTGQNLFQPRHAEFWSCARREERLRADNVETGCGLIFMKYSSRYRLRPAHSARSSEVGLFLAFVRCS